MGLSALPDSCLPRLSTLISGAMGLHFPRERWPEMQRGVAGAADELGFANVTECAEWLLSASLSKTQLQVLASHLTIGETYFFREKKTFEALATGIFPELRQRGERRLRIWSAACCTGEEAYSLAIFLRQNLPDLANWQVTILATDINARFLRKAVAGSYAEWSFRDAPDGFKESYFNRGGDGRYVIAPEIKAMVTFAHLNLVEDVYPSLATDTNAMDLIFCRNVLMYFTTEQIHKVVAKLHRSLIDGGCLAVSPSEASHVYFPQFATLNFPGAILYRKSAERRLPAGLASNGASAFSNAGAQFPAPCFPPLELEPFVVPPLGGGASTYQAPMPSPTPSRLKAGQRTKAELRTEAESLYAQSRYEEAADALLALATGDAPDPRTFSLLARAFANLGKLADALTWCGRWLAEDKMSPAGHYLRAVVLLERGDGEQARLALQRAIYLQPEFVLAYFALGNLARGRGKSGEAEKHFDNALKLLARYQPNDCLPESDGLTAGRLTETIAALLAKENSR